jgi:hypothetical protein
MKTYIDDLPATLAAMWQRQPTRRPDIIRTLTEFVASHPVAHRECHLASRMVHLAAKAKPAKAKRPNVGRPSDPDMGLIYDLCASIKSKQIQIKVIRDQIRSNKALRKCGQK